MGHKHPVSLHHLGMDNVARHKKHQLRRRINYGMDK